MSDDDNTLVEPIETTLLRAGFGDDDAGADYLRAALRSPDTRPRVLALRGLNRRGDVTAAEWLTLLLDDDVELRREAVLLIAHASVPEPVLAAVVTRLSDDDDLVTEGAAFALGEQLYREAVTALIDVATAHEDPRCREAAVAALGALGDDAGRAAVVAALSDKPPVRRRAIVALSNFEGPDIDAALEAASEDRDWQVRSAVAQLRSDEV